MKERAQRRIFLILAYGLLAAFFAWQILVYVLLVVKDPSSAAIRDYCIDLIMFGAYFAAGYCLVFLKGWSKIPPAEDTWPPVRCYGLLIWSLLTIHPSIPLCGVQSVRLHLAICVIVDILFLIRIITGRMKNEKGWTWQIYGVAYIWLVPILSELAVSFLF